MRRYGIRPGDLVAMPWGDWWPVRLAGVDAEYEETRSAYWQSAFIAWQLGAGEGQSFGRYLREFGLSDQAETSSSGSRIDQAQAMKDAKRIMAKDRKRRQAGG